MPDIEIDYDVALSFAGEDRKYVEAVADYLRSRDIRVFYDAMRKQTFGGKTSTTICLRSTAQDQNML